MANNVNLKRLAEELGLSITTVSRALADYSDVSPKTKERVRKLAQELGYRPNTAARRLVTGRSSAVGFIMHGAYGDFRDQFNSRLIVALSQALHDAAPNQDLIVTTVPQDKNELDTYKRFVDGGRVDSFIVARTLAEDPRVDFLLSRGVHFVTHGRTANSDRHCWVDTNAVDGFYQATELLIQRGHRRIVFLNFPAQLNTAILRLQGYRAAMEAADLPCRAINCEFGTASAYQPALELLAENQPPTAFVCASDVFAYAVLQACLDRGLVPGKDVSIIGSDNLPPVDINRPRLSTLDVSFTEVSDAIIQLLLDEKAARGNTRKHRLFDYQLLERDTTGPCPVPLTT